MIHRRALSGSQHTPDDRSQLQGQKRCHRALDRAVEGMETRSGAAGDCELQAPWKVQTEQVRVEGIKIAVELLHGLDHFVLVSRRNFLQLRVRDAVAEVDSVLAIPA